MPEIAIEIKEDGTIGTLPEPLQKFLDSRINDAYKRGAEKVEKELQGKGGVDAAERERLKLLEQENSRFKEEKALAEKNYEEARRLQEERLSKIAAEKDDALKAKDAEVAKRDARLKNMLGAEIRAAAIAAGAREESLPELAKLLGADLDLDADLQPFVKAEDGTPRVGKDGKPLSVEGLVTDYLAAHPHHLRGGRSQSGRAAGGSTFRGQASADPVSSAVGDLAANPSHANVVKAIAATRARAS